MDGVLIDSEKYQCKAFYILFHNHRLKYNKKDFKWVGKTSKQNIEYILKENNSNLNINKLVKEREDIYFSIIKNKIKPRSGIITLLKFLRNKGIKIGLASQSKRKNILYVLSLLNLVKYFDSVVSSEDVKHSKPNPDIYLQSCKKLNVEARECIAIEDSPLGINSALSAGINCLALLTEYYNKKDLKKADFIFKKIGVDKIKNLIYNQNVQKGD